VLGAEVARGDLLAGLGYPGSIEDRDAPDLDAPERPRGLEHEQHAAGIAAEMVELAVAGRDDHLDGTFGGAEPDG
jgi:hypothetical protein